MTDLNNLIAPSSGWTLTDATAINDDGWIVCDGTNGHTFLLTPVPVPEPSTLVLLAIGALGFLAFAWRRQRGRARCVSCAAVVVAMLIAGSAQADVFNMGGTYNPATGTWTGSASLQFVTVGNPGNAADPSTGYGSVGYTYQMGKYDVTVGQYVQFLNAVAKTDTYGLYNGLMASYGGIFPFGITQSGSSGSYSYSVTGSYAQDANCPMFEVSWGDAARFCNWLQNGQPTGPEGDGHDRNWGVHAQWRDHKLSVTGNNPQHRGDLLHSVGKRMVQGGVLQGWEHQRRLLELSHEEQRYAKQRVLRNRHEQRELRHRTLHRLHRPNQLFDARGSVCRFSRSLRDV